MEAVPPAIHTISAVPEQEIDDKSTVTAAETELRRRLIVIATLFATPMLLLFSMFEMQLNHTGMMIVTAFGAGLCLINLHQARQKRFSTALIRASLAYFYLLVAYYIATDFLTSSLLFALILPFASAFLLGYRESMIWNAIFGAGIALMIFYAEVLGLETLIRMGTDFVAAYTFICVIACAYERSRHITLVTSVSERHRLIDEIATKNRMAEKNQRLFSDLQHALREVRELTGLIPICASCKKIRSDEDFWEHVEGYLHRRTQLTFSHSICPCCADKAMAALDDEDPQARAG